MEGNQEIELKLRVLDSDCERITKDSLLSTLIVPGSQRVETFEATYYDTANGALSRAGLVLRVRREGENWVSTVKASGASRGGLSQRLEWNVTLEGDQPNISVYQDTVIGQRLQKALAEDDLLPLFVTRFERQSILLDLPDLTRLELAADRGEIITEERSEPIAEIELELKEGNIHELLKLGAMLAERHPLLPEQRSKFERGLKLTGLSLEEGEKSALKLGNTDKVRSVLPKVLLQKLYSLLEVQQVIVMNSDCAHELERFRNKLRQFASLVVFSRPFLGDIRFEQIQENLHALSREFSAWQRARVIQAAWEELVANQVVPLPQESLYRDMLMEEYQEQYDRIRAIFALGRATPVLLMLWSELMEVRTMPIAIFDAVDENTPVKNEYAKLSLSQYTFRMVNESLQGMLKAGKKPDFTDMNWVEDLLEKSVILRDNLKEFEPILSESKLLIIAVKELRENLRDLLDGIENIRVVNELAVKRSRRLLCHETGVFSGWEAHRVVMARVELTKTWRRFRHAVTQL